MMSRGPWHGGLFNILPSYHVQYRSDDSLGIPEPFFATILPVNVKNAEKWDFHKADLVVLLEKIISFTYSSESPKNLSNAGQHFR